MKKIIYILLAFLIVSVYACQKDNTAPGTNANKGLNATMKLKKDTTPPEFFKTTVKKDTTPPEFKKSTVRDTTPPEFLK
ncbi:hypothetical protein [Mucilaginibacter sp. AK015]|uniref:hypothetical protein n=1 Tax=Mucilaginibacter sp. AK015 TaxID=2723072 RepID=UPI00160F4573|nr:hypothetical protein [Mucilaginibacter sp. AK015]MBB5394197.1 hypothetical protein [Mucilaginibacter sp. AK015]